MLRLPDLWRHHRLQLAGYEATPPVSARMSVTRSRAGLSCLCCSSADWGPLSIEAVYCHGDGDDYTGGGADGFPRV